MYKVRGRPSSLEALGKNGSCAFPQFWGPQQTLASLVSKLIIWSLPPLSHGLCSKCLCSIFFQGHQPPFIKGLLYSGVTSANDLSTHPLSK